MHHDSSSDDAGYWPGFVAVLSSLVQGLLLLTAVVAAGIVTTNYAEMVKRRMIQNAAANLVLQPRETGPSEKKQDVPQSDSPVRLTSPPHGGSKAASYKSEPPWLVVRFPKDAVEWDADTRDAFLSEVKRVRIQQPRLPLLRLAGQVAYDDPLERRSAYMRLLMMRTALVNAGIPNSAIQTVQVPFSQAKGLVESGDVVVDFVVSTSAQTTTEKR